MSDVNGVSEPATPAMRRWELRVPTTCINYDGLVVNDGERVFICYAPDEAGALARLPAVLAASAMVQELPPVEDERHEFFDGRTAPNK